MAQSPLTGATVRIYNNAALPPPWQRGNTHHFPNDPQTKKRKLKTSRGNVTKRQANPPASQVTTHDRFVILEAEVAMDATTETIQKEVGKDEYKLKISNNSVKILPANPDAYRKLTKLLKNLNTNFHTYQLKQERPFRVVLRNIHHSVDLDELKFELQNLGHEI